MPPALPHSDSSRPAEGRRPWKIALALVATLVLAALIVLLVLTMPLADARRNDAVTDATAVGSAPVLPLTIHAAPGEDLSGHQFDLIQIGRYQYGSMNKGKMYPSVQVANEQVGDALTTVFYGARGKSIDFSALRAQTRKQAGQRSLGWLMSDNFVRPQSTCDRQSERVRYRDAMKEINRVFFKEVYENYSITPTVSALKGKGSQVRVKLAAGAYLILDKAGGPMVAETGARQPTGKDDVDELGHAYVMPDFAGASAADDGAGWVCSSLAQAVLMAQTPGQGGAKSASSRLEITDYIPLGDDRTALRYTIASPALQRAAAAGNLGSIKAHIRLERGTQGGQGPKRSVDKSLTPGENGSVSVDVSDLLDSGRCTLYIDVNLPLSVSEAREGLSLQVSSAPSPGGVSYARPLAVTVASGVLSSSSQDLRQSPPSYVTVHSSKGQLLAFSPQSGTWQEVGSDEQAAAIDLSANSSMPFSFAALGQLPQGEYMLDQHIELTGQEAFGAKMSLTVGQDGQILALRNLSSKATASFDKSQGRITIVNDSNAWQHGWGAFVYTATWLSAAIFAIACLTLPLARWAHRKWGSAPKANRANRAA